MKLQALAIAAVLVSAGSAFAATQQTTVIRDVPGHGTVTRTVTRHVPSHHAYGYYRHHNYAYYHHPRVARVTTTRVIRNG